MTATRALVWSWTSMDHFLRPAYHDELVIELNTVVFKGQGGIIAQRSAIEHPGPENVARRRDGPT